MTEEKHIKIACEGGGIKVLAQLFSLHTLSLNGYIFDELAGTSAGSIITALLAYGYGFNDIYEIFGTKLEFSRFKDYGPAAWAKGALCKGNYLENSMAKLLGDAIFSEIKTPLHIMATNVTKKKGEFFDHQTSPDMNVALAVRLSCSIPGYYVTKRHNRFKFWDGSFCANLPLEAFDNSENVIGILLKTADEDSPTTFWETFLIIPALIDIYFKELESRYIPKDKWKDILVINTGNVSTVDFSLNCDDLRKLAEAGVNGAVEFLVNKRGFVKENVIIPDVGRAINLLGTNLNE